MTAENPLQGKARSLANAIFFNGFRRVLRTAGKETATTPEKGAYRVAVKAYQREQQVFHEPIIEVRSSCSADA